MAWAEEQPWFGLEDLAIEAENEENDYIDELINNPYHAILHGFWITKDSDVIRLEYLTDTHLDNIIKMIEEGRLNRPWALEYLKNEKERRKETE